MKKESAPAKKRSQSEPCQSALLQIKILRLLQSPLGWVFWTLERRISQIEDSIDGKQ